MFGRHYARRYTPFHWWREWGKYWLDEQKRYLQRRGVQELRTRIALVERVIG